MNTTSFPGVPHSLGNDSNNTGVGSRSGVFSPLVLYIPRVLYPTCIFILITGNGLVLYGLARFKILRHPSNIFVGVLSGIDMTLSISFGILTMEAIDPDLLQGLFYCQFRVIILASNLLGS